MIISSEPVHINKKPGPVTKLDNRNTETLIKIYDGVISPNCDVIVIFPIYGQFRTIQKWDSEHTVCHTFALSKDTIFAIEC